MANFLSLARGPHLRAESKFVKLNCNEQVDFCPFRGPDAPFAQKRSYHEKFKQFARFSNLSSRAKRGTLVSACSILPARTKVPRFARDDNPQISYARDAAKPVV